MDKFHRLTSQEEKIIVQKGTEFPGSGKYNQENAQGVYVCKRCDFPLYLSSHKFDSHCGWPSFDDELPDAVLQKKDPDGRRVEILCRRCEGHLGHIFLGEELTSKNIRHCVNSLSLRFLSAKTENGLERIILGAGCFWSVQHELKKIAGVKQGVAGYCGGESVDPTYEEVCSGKTGHTEVVEILFDPKEISLERLLEQFFQMHEPSQKMKTQYQSIIFYFTPEQKEAAERLKKKKGAITEIRAGMPFYPAEDYHQNYYEKQGISSC